MCFFGGQEGEYGGMMDGKEARQKFQGLELYNELCKNMYQNTFTVIQWTNIYWLPTILLEVWNMAIMRQSPYSLNLYFSGESLIDNELEETGLEEKTE